MNSRQMKKWLKQHNEELDTLQELYALMLEGNYGIEAVKAWLDGKGFYDDPDFKERVIFRMISPNYIGKT